MIDTKELDVTIALLKKHRCHKAADFVKQCKDELDRLYALEKKMKADKAPPKCEFCGKFSNDLYACDGEEGPDVCPPCRKKYIEECKNGNS